MNFLIVTHDSSPGPLSSPNAGRGVRITESQGSTSQLLRVEVTVLRAHSVPRIKGLFGRKRRLFVSVVNDATVMETKSVQIDGRTVQWDQTLGAFSAQRSSHLILRLYAKRSTSPDILIGSRTTPIPVVSQSEVAFVLSNDDGEAGQSTQPVTLYLTITVLPSVSSESPIIPNNPPEIPTEGGDTSAEEITELSIVLESVGPIHSSAPDPLLPSSDPLSIETDTPLAHSQANTSPKEKALIALRLADEAQKPIHRKNKWKGALHPFAKMAYGLVSAIPETLLGQYERDGNVLALVGAMHDAFDFARHEDTLKSIKPDSKQAEILTLMLRDVCSCGDFIQSYVKDSQFWKRALKNMGGGVAKDIEELSAALVEHRKAFIDHSAITTEITAFQILDGVGILSARVDWMSTQLKWMSNQVSDAKLDAEIREIPHGKGSRFTSEKACLPGTRMTFLDFIVNWVDDPDADRTLILFGQAGTGKSSIAHEIARRFDKMHRLTSSYIFLRKQQVEGDAYHLFTTLARDLSDRYPSSLKTTPLLDSALVTIPRF
ncbi:hypothetical protein EDB84DRAFT_1506766 [Lactarius hengduanensis]|nr:hypothetical protein EDB84DRAFT_1506766 [Lactarius hengduanensis]